MHHYLDAVVSEAWPYSTSVSSLTQGLVISWIGIFTGASWNLAGKLTVLMKNRRNASRKRQADLTSIDQQYIYICLYHNHLVKLMHTRRA